MIFEFDEEKVERLTLYGDVANGSESEYNTCRNCLLEVHARVCVSFIDLSPLSVLTFFCSDSPILSQDLFFWYCMQDNSSQRNVPMIHLAQLMSP